MSTKKRKTKKVDPAEHIVDLFESLCDYMRSSAPVPDPGPNWIPAPAMNPEEVGFPPPHPEDQPEP